ncbi:MAG TPA: hypothetical protein VFJ85_12845 [Acidimicrobiales bacterium]|nr:hypothetical protein [Acidimicrobiales bacterium]
MDSPLTSPLHVQAWPDPVIDRLGLPPSSAYFEWLWLPRIGPSAAWAYRRLTSGLEVAPDGFDLELAELAHWLGVGGTGANSPLQRCLGRLVLFGLALAVDRTTLGLRRRVPPLSRAQLARLSPHLQRTHHRLVAAQPAPVAAAS